jgi:hypothetical protein
MDDNNFKYGGQRLYTDIFKEQLVKRKPRMTDFFYRCAGIMFVAAVFFLGLATPWANVMLIATLGLCFLMYYWFGFLNVEYEYSVTNDDLDIDAIYSKRRRKKKVTCNIKAIRQWGRADDQGKIHAMKQYDQRWDFTSGEKEARVYMFIIVINNKKCKILIEPNDEMLATIESRLDKSVTGKYV